VPVLAWNACQLDENLEHVQECVYYLSQYGNHGMLIKFYRTHGFWSRAVQYCIDEVLVYIIYNIVYNIMYTLIYTIIYNAIYNIKYV